LFQNYIRASNDRAHAQIIEMIETNLLDTPACLFFYCQIIDLYLAQALKKQCYDWQFSASVPSIHLTEQQEKGFIN